MSAAALTVERRRKAAAAAEKAKKAAKEAGLGGDGMDGFHAEPPDVAVENCYNQNRVRELYETPITQFTVAFLIFLNFIAEAFNAQILPEKGSTGAFVFLVFEVIFNVSFTIELIWNMYGSWFIQFWLSGWNWFDFIIVMISLLAMMFPALPGITVLRLFRAFRVFRLFKRIKSLKKIIEGVLGALPGVLHAFLVLAILMGIWSVIAVEFFKDALPEEFGNFLKSMYTMWQIMTMDSWSSGIARVLIFEKNMPMASVFFISYVFIAGIVMTNVVVAILLDKYLEAIDNDKKAEQQEKQDALADGDEQGQEERLTVLVHIDGLRKPLGAVPISRLQNLQSFLGNITEGNADATQLESEQNEPDEFSGDAQNVQDWSMDLVGQWLKKNDFSEWAEKFVEEKVNGKVLCQINEGDLIHLGMKLGRRKEFMGHLFELISEQDLNKKDPHQNQDGERVVGLSLWEPGNNFGNGVRGNKSKKRTPRTTDRIEMGTLGDRRGEDFEETFHYHHDTSNDLSVHHIPNPHSPPAHTYR